MTSSTAPTPRSLKAKVRAVQRLLIETAPSGVGTIGLGDPAAARSNGGPIDPLDELINTILSQNTNDLNRDRAYRALRSAFPTWAAVRDAPPPHLIAAIKPAGLANQKGPRLQKILERITAERGELNIHFLAELPVPEAKAWLTSLAGVGPKTAAIVLLFALGRPAFPVDTHIHRVTGRLGLIPPQTTAAQAHALLEVLVPPAWYQPFHLLVIQHGRTVCQARRPKCEICPLPKHCDDYQRRQAA